jgi:hypothetical protein
MTLTRTTRLALRLVRLAATEKRLQYLLRTYPKITPDQMQDMETVDPTGDKGAYLEWIVNRVNRGNIRWPEDRARVSRALHEYNALKKQPRYLTQYNVSGDINKYTLHDLEKINRSIHGDPALVAEPGEQMLPATKWFATINGGKDKILRVGGPGTDLKQSIQSACTLGEGTEWCTGGAEGEDSAQHYLEKGPLFIIYRDGKPYAQTDRDQLMDIHDVPIGIWEDKGLWEGLAEVGIFSKAKIAYEYASDGNIQERDKDIEKDLISDPKYRYLYITKILGPALFVFESVEWPEAEPYILRDGNPAEIYQYCLLCLGKKRWPAGEKVMLASKDPEVGKYIVLYAQKIMGCSWPEAEAKILATRVPASIATYAVQCKYKQRWPEAEAVLLSAQPDSSEDVGSVRDPDSAKGVGSVQELAYWLSYYAINNIGGRWPDAEPMIVRGGTSLGHYCKTLNIDPVAVVNNVIDRAKREKVNIEKTYPQMIMPVE